MILRPAALIAALVATLHAPSSLAVDAAPPDREHTITKDTTLVLPVPGGWLQKVEQKGDTPPLTVTYRDPRDRTWEFLVSVLWRPDMAAPAFDASLVRATVEASGMRALPDSVEPVIDLKEIAGAAAQGYYFRLTDKRVNLPAGEYKYLLQGMVGLGSVGLTFTLLSNSDDTALVQKALAIVQGSAVRKRP